MLLCNRSKVAVSPDPPICPCFNTTCNFLLCFFPCVCFYKSSCSCDSLTDCSCCWLSTVWNFCFEIMIVLPVGRDFGVTASFSSKWCAAVVLICLNLSCSRSRLCYCKRNFGWKGETEPDLSWDCLSLCFSCLWLNVATRLLKPRVALELCVSLALTMPEISHESSQGLKPDSSLCCWSCAFSFLLNIAKCYLLTTWMAEVSADLSPRFAVFSLNWFLRRLIFLEVIWLPPDSYLIRSREK